MTNEDKKYFLILWTQLKIKMGKTNLANVVDLIIIIILKLKYIFLLWFNIILSQHTEKLGLSLNFSKLVLKNPMLSSVKCLQW